MSGPGLQECENVTEAQALYEPLGLYLKPCAKLNICVQLPQLKTPGKAISNWEVMEKIKSIIKPKEFINLKIKKSTLEFIRFEGEVESKGALPSAIARLHKQTIKLSGFPDLLKVRAAESKVNFPAKHDWESFFRDARNMNQMKSGERPDTIYFQGLPCKWFANRTLSESGREKPSEYIVKKVFETYGEVRCLDIPMLYPSDEDHGDKEGLIQTFTFNQDIFFEAYVQFKEYIGFVHAMDSLKGMKLLQKNQDNKSYVAEIKVDFDKTKRLSAKAIRLREIRRERFEEEQKKKDEERKKLRDDERKLKEEEDRDRARKIRERISRKKEKKRLKKLELKRKRDKERRLREEAEAERKQQMEHKKEQATRLLRVLTFKVKVIKQREEIKRRMEELEQERLKNIEDEKKQKEEQGVKELQEHEKKLREKLLKSINCKQSPKKDPKKSVVKARLRSAVQRTRRVYGERPPVKIRSVLVQGRYS